MNERHIVIVTSVGHAICHIGELLFTGVMLAVMHEFELSRQEGPILALLGYILMGAGALPVGYWSDAFGPRKMLAVFFVAMTISSVMVACAVKPWQLFFALTALGLATSVYHPPGLALISLGTRSRGKALGIHGVAGSVGLTLGPALGLVFASGPPGTWRIAYLLLALSSAIAAIYLYRFVPAREDQQSRAKAWTEGDSHTSATASTCLPLLLLLAAMILGGFNYRLMVTIMPTYLSGESATSAELLQGGVFVLVAMSFGAAGQIASGFCSDRFGARRMYLGVIVMLIPCAVALSATGGTWLALVMACLLTFFMFAQQPLENSLLAEYTSRRRRGASYATKFALTFGVGALGAYVAGLFWEQYRSVAPVFHVIAFSAGLMVLLLFVFVVKTRTVATPSAASQRAVESPLVTWPIDRFAGERT